MTYNNSFFTNQELTELIIKKSKIKYADSYHKLHRQKDKHTKGSDPCRYCIEFIEYVMAKPQYQKVITQ